MKKVIASIAFAVVTTGVFYGLYEHAMRVNFPKYKEIRRTLIDHPEFIPTARTTNLTSAGFSVLVGDLYWLDTVQYVGSTVLGAEYKTYLAQMLNLITDLSPRFEEPYEFGELLLSSFNERYEKWSDAEQQKHTESAIKLGQKGLSVFCDKAKLEKIRKEFDLKKIIQDPAYSEPCTNVTIPFYLGYISYFVAKNPSEAAYYYRIAGANQAGPSGAMTLAAIMQGKTGDRERSVLMFLSLASNVKSDEGQCQTYAESYGKFFRENFSGIDGTNRKFPFQLLPKIDQDRKSFEKALGETSIKDTDREMKEYCSNYLNKAVRETNLYAIEQADAEFAKTKGHHAGKPEELQSAKLLPYVPVDYQENVVYRYDEKDQRWTYQHDYSKP